MHLFTIQCSIRCGCTHFLLLEILFMKDKMTRGSHILGSFARNGSVGHSLFSGISYSICQLNQKIVIFKFLLIQCSKSVIKPCLYHC
jgi:hypothetical protein